MSEAQELTHRAFIEEIHDFPRVVKEALLQAEGDSQVVDVLAEVKYSERQFGEQRRGVEAELDFGTTTGASSTVTIGRRAVRSYNTPSLLASFMAALDRDLVSTLLWLKSEGVLTLNWNWTPLQRVSQAHDVGVAIARHEIEDGDPKWDVGEVWTHGSASYGTKED